MEKTQRKVEKKITDLVGTQFIPWTDEGKMRDIYDIVTMAIFELSAGCGGEFRKRQENILEKEAPQKIREYFSPLFLNKLEELRQVIKKSQEIGIFKEICKYQKGQFPLRVIPLLTPDSDSVIGYCTEIPSVWFPDSGAGASSPSSKGHAVFWSGNHPGCVRFDFKNGKYSLEDRAALVSAQIISNYGEKYNKLMNDSHHKVADEYLYRKNLDTHGEEWAVACRKVDDVLKGIHLEEEYKRFLAEEADITKYFVFVDLFPRIGESLPKDKKVKFKGRDFSVESLREKLFIPQDYLVYTPNGLPYNAQESGAHFQINLDRLFNIQGLNEFTQELSKNYKR